MTKDWSEIYTQFNEQDNSLEILAVGETNDVAHKAVKKIPQEEIQSYVRM